MRTLVDTIVHKVWMDAQTVQVIIDLLDQGNTVPFIARYRKELTKWATDEQLRDFNDIYVYTKNLEQRKLDVIRLIAEKGLLTPELEAEIMAAETLARVEDLYRPFKEKKNTKATIAKAKWLDPLADILRACEVSKEEFEQLAAWYIKDTGDKKTSVGSVQEAIQGAKDIVAEEVSDDAALRDDIRSYEENNAVLETKPTKTFEENGVYKIYGSYSKKIADMPSYAYLAVSRAEDEKQLSIKVQVNTTKMLQQAKDVFIPAKHGSVVVYLEEAIEDGLQRLLIPSLEREIRSNKKRRSDEAAIKVFGDNMKHLLLTPPVRWMKVLGFDPWFRTWCKLAVVDETGKFLFNDVIYPTNGDTHVELSEKKLLAMVKEYAVDLIVIWNGTASRESERFVSQFIKKHTLPIKYLIASEAGASVYSASELAQEEYPDLDVTVRGAISIAHRVQDPLAELTKITPKSIGVGQYQHDVDQKLLGEKLDEKVEDVVNKVGVNVNTASYTLLQYVAWLSLTVAKNVVAYRDEHGAFTSKTQLKKVKWLGPKAYEQCIWFLRIIGWKEPLDATGIHPEVYDKIYEILDKELHIKPSKKEPLVLPLSASIFAWRSDSVIARIAQTYEMWFETLVDSVQELQRPGLDPRENMDPPSFKADVLELKDLQIGMKLDGVVRNVTDFGAFVDIGLHNDWLVHKSQLADRFVAHPSDVVSVWQQVEVTVVGIDEEREKVSLSMKASTQGWNIGGDKVRESIEKRNVSGWRTATRSQDWESTIKNTIVWG